MKKTNSWEVINDNNNNNNIKIGNGDEIIIFKNKIPEILDKYNKNNKVVKEFLKLFPNENKYFCIKILELNNYNITNTLVWIISNKNEVKEMKKQINKLDKIYNRKVKRAIFKAKYIRFKNNLLSCFKKYTNKIKDNLCNKNSNNIKESNTNSCSDSCNNSCSNSCSDSCSNSCSDSCSDSEDYYDSEITL
tara:strand:- start:1999 stop:2571 length:573 start_codon:yes stop_codon:yes gene_type:complete